MPMDRKPLAAPFPVGTQVRYAGTGRVGAFAADGSTVWIRKLGLVVTVDEVKPGRRGSLLPLPGEWEDDDPPPDTTVDGYSVYHVEVPGERPCGQIIWPANAHEWEKV